MQLDFLKPAPIEEPNDSERGWLAAYRAHLKSKQWKIVRAHMLAMAHGECQKCGQQRQRLEVHHKTYEHLGDELLHLDDLLVLCRDCHAFEDKLRAESGKLKSQQALAAAIYDSGRDTYMTKKYGPDWQLACFGRDEWYEYDEWLDRKRDRD